MHLTGCSCKYVPDLWASLLSVTAIDAEVWYKSSQWSSCIGI